jgi:hypothetical protein
MNLVRPVVTAVRIPPASLGFGGFVGIADDRDGGGLFETQTVVWNT